MIEKILNKIRWIMLLFVTTNFQKKINKNIGLYYQYHFIICLWLSVFLGVVLSFILPIVLGIIIGTISAFLLVSIGKELIWDLLLGNGTFDWWDIFANLCGSIAGGLLVGFISLIVIELLR